MEIAGYCGHPESGIVLYKKVWPDDSNFVERLEGCIGDSTLTSGPYYSWKKATVGDMEEMPDYRDCSDFKMNASDVETCPPEFAEAAKVYQEVMAGVRECVTHYSGLYNLQLEYEEATNFVRYFEGQHFAVHADHGFSYVATVSAIGYLNDDYEGGEYMLPYQDIKFLPEAGDVIIHPSTFVYAHASLAVTKGTKYSAVTMYDYNDRNHQDHQSPYASGQNMPTGPTATAGQIVPASEDTPESDDDFSTKHQHDVRFGGRPEVPKSK